MTFFGRDGLSYAMEHNHFEYEYTISTLKEYVISLSTSRRKFMAFIRYEFLMKNKSVLCEFTVLPNLVLW